MDYTGFAFPKGTTRLQKKVARVKDDEKQLRQWRAEVFSRDEGKCRKCGVRVVKLSIKILHPRRAECHHIAGRDDLAVKYDTRNGVLLCLQCHQTIAGKILGTVFFRVNRQRYMNADYPLEWAV